MQHNYHNISQTGRRIAGMTQERWAEALDISVESVRLYESGRGMSSDDVATRMVEVSGAPVICSTRAASRPTCCHRWTPSPCRRP